MSLETTTGTAGPDQSTAKESGRVPSGLIKPNQTQAYKERAFDCIDVQGIFRRNLRFRRLIPLNARRGSRQKCNISWNNEQVIRPTQYSSLFNEGLML